MSFSITLKSSWWNSKKGSAIRVPSRRQRWRRLYSQATPQRTNTPHDSFLKHSEATCKRAQQLPTMLGVVSQQCCVRLHGAKSLTRFKLCVTTCNRVCKRTQHVTSNKVGNCGSTMLHPFARSPILTLTSTMAWTQSSVLSKLRSAGRCWAIGDEAQESKNSLVKLPLLGFSSAVLGSVTKCSKKNLRHIHKAANSARWPEIRLYSFSLGIWIEIPAGKAKRIESPIKARMRMREYMKTAELGPGLRLSARLKCINYHYEPKRKEHACSRSFLLVL